MKKSKRIDINYEWNTNKSIILDCEKLKITISNEDIEFNKETIQSDTYDVFEKDLNNLIDNNKCSKMILNMEYLYISKSNQDIQLSSKVYKEIKCKDLQDLKDTIFDISNQYYSNEQLVNNLYTYDELHNMINKGFYTKEDYNDIEKRHKIKLDTKDYLVVGFKPKSEQKENNKTNINNYIIKKCAEFNLTEKTSNQKINQYYKELTSLDNKKLSIKDKKIYLYDYLVNDMIRNKEIKKQDGKAFMEQIEKQIKSKSKERSR